MRSRGAPRGAPQQLTRSRPERRPAAPLPRRAPTRAQQAAAKADNSSYVGERRVDYILKTGANWAGPIADFTLTADLAILILTINTAQQSGEQMAGTVIAVSRSPGHTFSKPAADSIRLLVGLGVEGDAHRGVTVKHRSRVAKDPTTPNLRQVHLIHAELHDELEAAGFRLRPGAMGENVTTQGIDLLGLPTGTRLRLGADALIEITGLRNPCRQLNDFQPGLMNATLDRDAEGKLIRKAGVMAIVLTAGEVNPGDTIEIELPAPPHCKLEPV